jgi:hypothetical protein
MRRQAPAELPGAMRALVRRHAQLEMDQLFAGRITVLPTLSPTPTVREKLPVPHGKAAIHAGVAPGVSGAATPEQAAVVHDWDAGFQQRPSLVRLSANMTVATPESASPASPQRSAAGVPQPARQAAPEE